uniref:F-box domain-containing protein n=1 Tax=Oryza glumipatula TaxID=40148 RepID=A0A0E0B7P7_9ORYZ
MMNRRRQRPTSPAPLLDNDDLLSEILLRLPPQPSSLPRASLVCKRWRRLVSDHGFLRRFRARHHFSLDLWKNKTNCDDATGWVLERTIQLDKLLSVEPGPRITSPCLGFVEEHNMLFVSTRIGGFLVHLESMQFKKLPQTIGMGYYYPFCSFDTKGNFFPCVFTLYI